MMKKSIEELEKERHELYEKISDIDEQIRAQKLIDINLDMEGKYIKYKDTFGTTYYSHVSDVINDKYYCHTHELEYAYLIRGHGFDYEFTGYGDATNFYWSYWYEFRITGRNVDEFVENVKKIEIITKEEFDNEFENGVSNLIDYKNKYENAN